MHKYIRSTYAGMQYVFERYIYYIYISNKRSVLYQFWVAINQSMQCIQLNSYSVLCTTWFVGVDLNE